MSSESSDDARVSDSGTPANGGSAWTPDRPFRGPHGGYGSRLVDDEAAFQAAHVLAKAMHDHFCGCSTYCEKPQPDLDWHDRSRFFVGVVLSELNRYYDQEVPRG